MNDHAALLERIDELEEVNRTLQVDVESRDAKIAQLRQNNEALKRMIWGGSEKRSSAASRRRLAVSEERVWAAWGIGSLG